MSIIISNINLNELLTLLNDISKETGVVDMEVNQEEKTILFIPIIKKEEAKEEEEKQVNKAEEIGNQLKKMKEEYEQIKNQNKLNLDDLTKLV